MNKLTFLTTLALLVFSGSLFSQNFSLVNASQNQVELQHTLDEFKEVHTTIQGKSYQAFSKTTQVVMMEEGKPALPLYSQAVLLPNNGEVNFSVEHDGFYEIENIWVAPSKGNLKRNVNPETIPHTFAAVYQEDAFFPGQLGEISEPFILRNTRGTVVTLFPYQYNPVTKTLRVYENMRVVVHTDASKQGENELSTSVISPEKDAFSRFYHSLYINMPISSKNYPILDEAGEMLVIAADEYLDAIAPLVEWKIKKGINTTIVPVSEAGATSQQIKSFIQNYYAAHPQLVYILLVGDADKIPAHTYGYEYGEERWSDSYYGQLVGNGLDFFPEAFVGRFSGNADEIAVMVERTIEYEQNPMQGDWMTKGIGVASNEGAGYGNNGLSDFQHLRNIRYQFLDYDFDYLFEFYEGSQGEEDAPGNPTTSMLNNAINQGIGLFNYTGHGWTHGMSTGDYTNSDVFAATNNGMYPFVISVACNNGTFVGETCLAEAMLNATHNGSPSGAIAAAGSSILMSWAPPMQTQVEMTNLITRMYENNHKETLGGLFYNSQMSVLVNYANSAVAREVMQTWVFFGDPSVTYRYRATQD
ncbi:MAG TPA: C25 family cysteine peptidase, partial [Flavobacteriaceae bacterium]|nr:C25 family cysteine peptidase [Flavobacteriaceae bacterium]